MRFLIVLLMLIPGLLMADSYPADKIDPPIGGMFPGDRGADEMIVYTPAGSRQRTGTNQWGTEAVVVRGIVRLVGDNDHAIPADGFVISGHGKAARWIEQNLAAGDAVRVDGMELVRDDSPAAVAESLAYRLDVAEETIRALAPTSPMLTVAEGLTRQIDTMIASKDYTAMSDLGKKVDAFADEAWETKLASMTAPRGEIHAVWYRLYEHTPEDIRSLVEDWSAAGINVVFPESIYASQAIFADETGFYAPFPQFGEMDAMAVLIEECHKRQIEVHAWVHCFFIGIEGNEEEPPLLAERYPEWLANDRQGRRQSVDEPGFMYFNPALPEVRKSMIDAYVALARNYDIDGFQFDYIRYCSAADWRNGWDYSDYTRERVKRELGFDPLEITPDANPGEWKQWLDWRENVITTFVQEASRSVRAADPNLVISADVFPDLQGAISNKGQNWGAWGHAGHVDSLIPMCYTSSVKAVGESVAELDAHLPDGLPLVIGLGPYLGLSPRKVVEQIEESRRIGATGQCLFSWNSMTPELRRDLARGPWSGTTPARWPHQKLAD